MSTPLIRLIEANRLERLDDNLFRGYDTWKATSRFYGGEVMSQSISAAQHTVSDDYILHSFHAYFMRPGELGRAVIYEVEHIRDGRSFLSRRVTARQRGQIIYSCQCSFQPEEKGFNHQTDVAFPPGPEGIKSDHERLEELFGMPINAGDWPIEYRQVHPATVGEERYKEPNNAIWFRANGEVPDDDHCHQQLLAYAVDLHLLAAALPPHNVNYLSPNIRVASIDHSMWFHCPLRIDQWLLYEVQSPWAGNGRGLSFGRIYDQEGTLVASTAQEGMFRLKD